MSVEQILKLIGLLDVAFETWEANSKDVADLLALREAIAGMTHEQKVAMLRTRSESLQDRADELGDE